MEKITQVKCLVPFTRFSIHAQGYGYSCCPIWTKLGSIGRLTSEHGIMDIWNGEASQNIRRAVLDDQLAKVCNFKYCPYAIKNQPFHLETLKGADANLDQIIDQIMAGRTVLDSPPYLFELANSSKCNLRCVMCMSKKKVSKQEEQFDELLYAKIIPDILPRISRIFLAGNGEVLFNPHSRRFLQTLDPKRYPLLKIQLLTNGTMLTPKVWETINHLRYDFISVSVDAASKETYEKVRRNGNWDVLRRNLDFLGELRRQKEFWFSINFIVMKSNYQEMKDFVKLGLQLGCDQIVFEKIFGQADIRENINFTHHKKIFTEIARILTDPIFTRPEVDTTLINEYRGFLDQPVAFGDTLLTKGKEWLHYLPR